MHGRHTTPDSAGFALAEALVSLLLLALATVAGGTAMVHSLAGQRAALLRTQATDLAADLAEALRAAPDAAARESEIQSWQAAVAQRLPQGQSNALQSPAGTALSGGFDVLLRWRDGRDPPASLQLTVATASGPQPP